MDLFGENLYNLYGSTETAWATIATPEDLRAAPGTAGRPPRGTTVRLYDDDALEVEPGATAALDEVRAAVLALRRGKGMVIDAADPDTVSAGSFFMNPILDPHAYARLDPAPPAFPQPDGRIKTSAAWLIERSGFRKGYARGRVAISSKHALALVNRGGATTQELVALAREIAAGVRRRFGVQLQPEPTIVGEVW
jgi:UDP-N-acetylmuramate dehydrogenase